MARIDNFTNFATDVADSIREMTGTTEQIPASEFDTRIKGIKTAEDLETELNDYNTKLATQKTSIQDIMTALKTKGTQTITLQDKTVEITENGTTNIVADEGYDGLNNVEVTTNISGGETPEVGFVVNEFDSEGYPKTVTTYGLTTIPNYYFGTYSSSYLNGLIKNLKTINLNKGITTIEHSGFYANAVLEEITLPDTVETISSSSFNICSNLTTIKLSNNLKTIDSSAFYKCAKLVLNTLPDTVTSLGEYSTFYGCTGLKQISFNNVTYLKGSRNMGIFTSCSGLKAVWIGSAITNITAYAFSSCTSLLKIFINLPRATVETLEGYSYKFMNKADSTVEIICNDDEGFMTKEEFDAIDWSTYEG